MRRAAIPLIVACAIMGTFGLAWGQGFGFGQRGMRFEPNAGYDGRFTFVRIRYTVYRRSGWEFDYPTMERNLMLMAREITSLRPKVRESNVYDLDDPELMKYPIAYLSEPGYWVPSDSEVLGLRKYL